VNKLSPEGHEAMPHWHVPSS